MSSYLTSGKIALLVLVELYADELFPHVSVLPVLSFVIRNLVAPKDSGSFVLDLTRIKEATLTQPSVVVGRTIFDLLLKRLWELNSFDALHSFFTDIQSLVVDPNDGSGEHVREPGERCSMSKNSILGCFIRRASLEYTRLQFNDAVSLWRSFVVFREPTLAVWKKRNPGAGAMSFDVNLEGLGLRDLIVEKAYGDAKDNKSFMVSTDDVERLLEFQVDIMQRIGSRVPDEVQVRLKGMFEMNVAVPSLSHYVEFLNCWRAGDYPGSFDNLHRYFDYTMHNRDRTFYQYALLNLSILQADFGCYRESILAMQETINTARENKDMACLNFSLSWLYHFHKAHPQDCPEVIASRMERDSLQFLKSKAKEGGMHHLHSMAHLSEAKQILLSGESVPAAFESLIRSSHLNVTKYIRNAMGSQILLQSSLWSRLGVGYLATMNCDIFLYKYREDSPVEDIVKAVCRRAYICAMRGRFDEAFERLDEVEATSLRTLKVSQYWAAYIGLIKLQQAVYKDEFAAADLLLQQLLALPYVEPDCAFEIAATKIDLLLRTGNIANALQFIAQLSATQNREQADVYQRSRLLLLKAQCYKACGRPIKGISTAISACDIAWKARLMPGVFNAYHTIAVILIELREYSAADAMLDSIMPQVLECEDTLMNARCFECLADAQVGIAGGREGETRARHLHRGVDFIDRAFAEYSKLRDVQNMKQMISRKSKIQDFLGDKETRNDAVKRYRELEKGV